MINKHGLFVRAVGERAPGPPARHVVQQRPPLAGPAHSALDFGGSCLLPRGAEEVYSSAACLITGLRLDYCAGILVEDAAEAYRISTAHGAVGVTEPQVQRAGQGGGGAGRSARGASPAC